MAPPLPELTLADWRRRVGALYGSVRAAPAALRADACAAFRTDRDQMFRSHPDSPLRPERRDRFDRLAYYPYQPGWRVEGSLEPLVEGGAATVELGPDGLLRYRRMARVHFESPQGAGVLSVFWIEGYGGGLFLPFRDGSSGRDTFGGGRYLLDTIKGADLGSGEGTLVLDFNYAYNPSCAYDSRWVCPLAPPENTLPFAVPAGEKAFE